MPADAPQARRSPARGFTLIEVLVVVMILAILAALAVPRLSGTTRRRFDLAADQVADLLVMFAQRDTLGQKPVGLSYDRARRELSLVVLEENDSGITEWHVDHFVAPVKLPDVVDPDRLVVVADGELVDIASWPLAHTPSEDRPSLEVSLHGAEDDLSATLVLSPHDVSPRRIDARSQIATRYPVDLDAAGRSREEW